MMVTKSGTVSIKIRMRNKMKILHNIVLVAFRTILTVSIIYGLAFIIWILFTT